MRIFFLLGILLLNASAMNGQKMRIRDHGIEIGVMEPGLANALTDVPGVKVGHLTYIESSHIRTGVTAIIPHDGNLYQQKVPAAIYLGNGFGKLMGYSQVKELGNIETPIILTNTLSVPTAANALLTYTLNLPGNEDVRSVNALVGETNDGWLNDIRGRNVSESQVLKAITNASDGKVAEGNVGAGTGTVCFGFKGGIGTSSRVLPEELGGYTVGVLVQTNFGGTLRVNGVPVGKKLGRYAFQKALEKSDGSCMIVVITDAPLSTRNLERVAKRSMLGLARTGGIASNGSGDYAIAVSTAEENLVPHESTEMVLVAKEIHNDRMSALFLATIEATEEAILNSLFVAEDMTGFRGREIKALPVEKILPWIK